MKYYLGSVLIGVVLLASCTTANADTDLEWSHNNNQGEAKNHVAEEINNLKHSPQDAVDKINSLYEGTVVEVELDGDDGVYYYEIEIVNGDIKYDSKVDADNLEVIKLEKDGADSEESLNSVKRITPEAALEIADGEVDGEITGWELENDKYEIVIETDGQPVIVEIDALTADILNKEVTEEEKKDTDGSGGRGDEEKDDKASWDDTTEEQVKAADSKSKKASRADGEESQSADEKVDGSKMETAEAAQDTEPAQETAEPEQTQENQETAEESEKPDSQQNPDYQNGVLTAEAAINIALNEVGGTVVEWEYDDDDFEYEIELISNGLEVEMEISALNGAILEIEYDD
ncbi:PepSY domain-containing protein [Lacicoccus qingdaonensis]|uniref:Uncharacterized membrane protein YkoI n=1 Tax=Lacicoccus qingdaonensis TaxID=576118 RepID=A0A1G9D742_9BACL|nr:PepSY domain-containing protein [Salinicoccus qingdaonensis]SDK59732.1 Uncharacterized membrane protein YkoI [Salinicoccus qingdaonensis]